MEQKILESLLGFSVLCVGAFIVYKIEERQRRKQHERLQRWLREEEETPW